MTFRIEEHPELLNSIIDTMVDGVTVLDAEGNIIYANKQAEVVFGLTQSTVMNRKYNSPEWKIQDFHGFDIPDERLPFQKVLRTGKMLINDGLTLVRPNGDRRYLNINGASIKDKDGKVQYCVFNVYDITDSYLMSEAIKKNKDQLEMILNTVPAMVFFKDTRNNIIRVNKVVAEALGVVPEIMANTPSKQWYPDEADAYYDDDLKVIKTGKPKLGIVELNDLGEKGKIWVRTDKFPIFDKDGKIEGVLVFAQDITSQKKAQEEVEIHRDQLDMILNTMPAMVFFKDTKNNHIRVNKAVADSLGVTPKDVANTPVSKYYEDADRYYEDDLIVIKTGKPKIGIVEVIDKGKKGKIWGRTDKYPIFDDNGNVTGVLVFAVDITPQKEAEEKIKESEVFFRSFFENAGTGALIVNPERRILEVNAAFCDMLGYSEKELTNMKVEDITHPEDILMSMDIISRTTKKEGLNVDVEKKYIKKNGQSIWVRVTANWIFDDNGKALYGMTIVSDIEKRKEAEQVLKDQQADLERRVDERTVELGRKNLALTEVLGQIEIEKKQMQDNILANVEELLLPAIDKLRRKGTKYDQKYLDVLEENIKTLTSGFSRKLAIEQLKLTPKEIEICNMIKNGMSTKEISQTLNLSTRTVENHRNHIRSKLGISRKGLNLISYLKSL